MDNGTESTDTNSTLAGARRHPATIVSWIALAIAILIAGYAVHDTISPSDLRPGGDDTAGLPQIGDPAPDFEAVDEQGNVVRLSDFAGQPVWLNFWGSWCPPCRAEAPDMIQAYDQLQDRGIVLLAVSLEEPSEDAFSYAREVGMTFDVVSDPDREGIKGKYRVRSYPTHLFIDEDGIVRDIVLTPMSVTTAIRHAEKIS
ncbi:MAG: peroxiredoxin family protein [Chloroflexota bacterium]